MSGNAEGKDTLRFHDSDKQRADRDGIERDRHRTVTALAQDEIVKRYGSAGAEYIKGFRGVDNETGQRFARGLAEVAKHKVNPDYAAQNIKQQAGFSAEIAATSRDNAEAIIQGDCVRTVRSDDLAEYGRNHNVVDRVKMENGVIVDGSQSQMKFVGNRDKLFNDIARDDGKFARYRGVKLELPSEQYEGAAEHCRQQAQALRIRADRVEAEGKADVADKFRREADNFDQLAENVCDSGLTTEQAIFYREHPGLATVKDIARTSHRAGTEGARTGAVVGGAISLATNLFSLVQQKKMADDVVKDVATDTAKAAALGYGTAFTGSALKAGLQQSEREALRALARTSVPALAVNICLSLGTSIRRYVNEEIDEAALLSEIGEKGAGMLSGGMMAALGQVAIPVPVLGAAIGSMMGYTLSSLFYQSALEAAQGAALSRTRLTRIRAIEAEARAEISRQQAFFDAFTAREMPLLHREVQRLSDIISAESVDVNDLAFAINEFATLSGAQLSFSTLSGFEDFMNSDKPLIL